MSNRAESLWLPPRDAQLINPDSDKIETPTDDRGLIDVELLIETVKETVDPAFHWGNNLSIHHLYWPKSHYTSSASEINNPTPTTFRELPIHTALVPRVFENWLHKITLPPTIPTQEVMHYRIEAWSITKDLFKTARAAVLHEKLARRRRAYIEANPQILKVEFNGQDKIGEEYIQSEYERHFHNWEYQRQRYSHIPEEFKLIPVDKPMVDVAAELGKLIAPNALQLVRAVRSTAS